MLNCLQFCLISAFNFNLRRYNPAMMERAAAGEMLRYTMSEQSVHGHTQLVERHAAEEQRYAMSEQSGCPIKVGRCRLTLSNPR